MYRKSENGKRKIEKLTLYGMLYIIIFNLHSNLMGVLNMSSPIWKDKETEAQRTSGGQQRKEAEFK